MSLIFASMLLSAAACGTTVGEHALVVEPSEDELAALDPVPVLKDRAMKKRVAFWKRVWGEVPEKVWLIVERDRPWKERGRFDCRPLIKSKKLSDADKDLICKEGRRTALLEVAKKARPRVILVEGKREKLDRARERGAPHRARARQIFAAKGVPPALSDLAIVESLFRSGARSRASAVGAYQFVKASARPFMTVNDLVDERLDVSRAALGSASYLRQLHDRFGDWPIAVTAYNAGPTRMRRLLDGSKAKSLPGIMRSRAARRDRRFGFDAANYWAQIAAVLEVVKQDEVSTRAAPRLIEVKKRTTLGRLARCLKVTARALKQKNPALIGRTVPKGYLLAL